VVVGAAAVGVPSERVARYVASAAFRSAVSARSCSSFGEYASAHATITHQPAGVTVIGEIASG
jgi:hypothetical protein